MLLAQVWIGLNNRAQLWKNHLKFKLIFNNKDYNKNHISSTLGLKISKSPWLNPTHSLRAYHEYQEQSQISL
jgi:hypothetical protein